MDNVKVISTGKDFNSSISDLLGGVLVKSASLNHEVGYATELTVTINLTKEQEKQLLGKE